MDVVTNVCLAALGVGLVLCVVRAVIGPTLPDRVVALDTLVLVILAGIAVGAARTGQDRFVDVLLVVALVGFVATSSVARYMERRQR